MKNETLLTVGLLAFALAADATPSIPASISITELSSTLLSYSLSGGTPQFVTTTTPDSWTFGFDNVGIITSGSTGNPAYIFLDWEEPDYATTHEVNLVTFYQYRDPANGSSVTVTSDILPDPNHTYPVENNGQTYTFNYSDAQTATFTDDGDDPVPDGGFTAMLVGMSLTGLGILRRKLS